MRTIFKSAKPILLVTVILLGVAAEVKRARAAQTETAIFAGGCFWCVESDFESVRGVGDVVSGFTGGRTANPVYPAKGTGHFEAVRIPYDPARVSYRQLLDLFFRSIDPTDAGGQFCDRGPAYRTAVFVKNAEERRIAEEAKAAAQRELGKTIVTPILDSKRFWPVDEYHQDYYKQATLVLTRRGPMAKSKAYKFYRDACGRDDRVRQLWGNDAPFVGGHS